MKEDNTGLTSESNNVLRAQTCLVRLQLGYTCGPYTYHQRIKHNTETVFGKTIYFDPSMQVSLIEVEGYWGKVRSFTYSELARGLDGKVSKGFIERLLSVVRSIDSYETKLFYFSKTNLFTPVSKSELTRLYNLYIMV
jgi:hypothetical protein